MKAAFHGQSLCYFCMVGIELPRQLLGGRVCLGLWFQWVRVHDGKAKTWWRRQEAGGSLKSYSHPTAVSLPLELQTQSRRDESLWTFTSSTKATLPELPQTEPPAEEQVLKWQRLGSGGGADISFQPPQRA